MPRPSLLKAATLPAPVGGMNVADPGLSLPASEAALVLNAIAGEGGLKPRPGTQVWASGVGSSGPVRSVLPYHGSSGTEDRLFATSAEGIYDATTSGAASLALAFGTTTGKAGRGVSAAYANTAGRFLLYTDEVNGYRLYTEGTHAWTTPTLSGGITAADCVFVLPWKNRVWFAQRNSSKAWYLALEAISGAAAEFDFGRHFKRGGYLLGLWNWTRDGGSGADDRLVALSSGGDIVVFEGTDPSIDTTFNIVGSWNVGSFPDGRRLCTSIGGDLLVLTTQGLLSMEKLLAGGNQAAIYDTRKLRPLFISTMQAQQALEGWDLAIHPQEAMLVVNQPGVSGQLQQQFALSLATQGWSLLQGLDILSLGVWQGQLYFGNRAAGIVRMTGILDGVAQDGSTANARQVECFLLHAFNTLGSPRRKQLRVAKPHFKTDGVFPGFAVFARYDFDTSLPTGLALLGGPASGALWGSGLWGVATWGARSGIARRAGVTRGIGTAIAVGVTWKSNGLATLCGTDVWWEEGGDL